MKIALFTETYFPDINGVVTHVKTLKDGLEQLGHKVLIVTADSRVRKHETLDDVMYCPAIKIKKIYNYDLASPLSMERLKLIRNFKPDIIHIHNEFGIGMSGIMIAKILSIPVVYTLHTMYDEYIYYIANKHFCKFITGFTHKYAKAIANSVGAITCPSQKGEYYFKKCGVKRKINIISNSAELDKYDREKIDKEEVEKIKQNYGFTKEDTIFLFCGRLGKEKNLSWLINAFAKKVKSEDGIKLFIIGGGPLYEQHKEEIKKLGAEDRIILAGIIDHNETPPYYAMCDSYVTSSLSEAYSISMIEAMSMGLPVLHINDDLNRGQIKDGVNGFIYKNSDELYILMKKIKDMPKEELHEFGKKVKQSVIGSSEELSKNILNIYNTVIKENINKRKRGITLK